MRDLTAEERRLSAFARSVRVAIVVPSLLALTLFVIEQREIVGFAVLGTFAHLVLVNYGTLGGTRYAQAALLTLLGLITISLGTLASSPAWLAVSGAAAAGFVAEVPARA